MKQLTSCFAFRTVASVFVFIVFWLFSVPVEWGRSTVNPVPKSFSFTLELWCLNTNSASYHCRNQFLALDLKGSQSPGAWRLQGLKMCISQITPTLFFLFNTFSHHVPMVESKGASSLPPCHIPCHSKTFSIPGVGAGSMSCDSPGLGTSCGPWMLPIHLQVRTWTLAKNQGDLFCSPKDSWTTAGSTPAWMLEGWGMEWAGGRAHLEQPGELVSGQASSLPSSKPAQLNTGTAITLVQPSIEPELSRGYFKLLNLKCFVTQQDSFPCHLEVPHVPFKLLYTHRSEEFLYFTIWITCRQETLYFTSFSTFLLNGCTWIVFLLKPYYFIFNYIHTCLCVYECRHLQKP